MSTEVATPDGAMEIYEATPDGAPRGAIIVVQEAFGVNDHIQDVTQRFAAAGYHAVAPALFHRAGGGTAPYNDFTKVMPLFEGVTDDGILADVDATIAHLEDAGFGPEQIGIVGFCFGGRVTFLVATRRTQMADGRVDIGDNAVVRQAAEEGHDLREVVVRRRASAGTVKHGGRRGVVAGGREAARDVANVVVHAERLLDHDHSADRLLLR